MAGSTVPSTTDLSGTPKDEETGITPSDEPVGDGFGASDDDLTPRPRDGFMDEFVWDDMEPESSGCLEDDDSRNIFLPLPRTAPFSPKTPATPTARTPRAHEGTPLLRRSVSFSATHHPRYASPPNAPVINEFTSVPEAPGQSSYQSIGQAQPSLPRRSSTSSGKGIRYNYGGKSTNGQTVYSFLRMSL